ncbi:Tetratricopeptide repeat-containing protein [Candidatus Electronema halotolerans]|jgi:hypothetical protein
MTVSAGFLIYVALYRLTVLAVGALSIWLGFRLFNNAGSRADDSVGSASAEGNGFKLALTSILPGTYFALFGTVIISIMLWKGEPPQLSEKQVIEQPGKATVSSERLMREDCRVNPDGIAQEWETLGKSGLTLTEAAGPLHKIACYYWSKNRIGEAVAMAKLAALYGKDEDKADHLALLAELLRANGDEEGAAKTEQAVEALRRQGQ